MGTLRHCLILTLVVSCNLPQALTGEPPQDTKSAPADLTYVDAGFATGVIARPRRVLRSKMGQSVIQRVFQGVGYEDMTNDFARNFGVELHNVDQLSVFVREKTIARMVGISLPKQGEAPGSVASEIELINNLKQIALAAHNHADVYNRFPSATGGLSWRVHLLPYMEQIELYEQFNLDEDWDSDTNKALIEKMPDIFKVPGVEAKGKTSIHVFVGEDAPFEEERVSFRNIIDGTSNTIMSAMAGADTAEEWTKPGGLKINQDDPTKSFGDLDGKAPLVAMFDGSCRRLPEGLDAEMIKALLTPAGGEVVAGVLRADNASRGPDVRQNPTLIAHCVVDIDQEKALAQVGQGFDEPVKKRGNGQEYWDVGGYAIWFPNSKTLVATQQELLPRMMKPRGKDSPLRTAFKAMENADVAAAGDVKAMPTIFTRMVEGAPFPNLKEIASASVQLDVSAKAQPLLKIDLNMTNGTSATGMQAMLGGALAGMMQQLNPANAPPGMEGLLARISKLTRGVKVERKDANLSYTVSKPGDYDGFIKEMEPQLTKLGVAVKSARSAAKRVEQMNHMRQVGLAFHNYHDVYGTFPAADGTRKADKRLKGGLSWRVHLLPFLEHADLYEQFKLNEPWDSEHNKKLIDRMPEVFKVKGVEGVGKTSVHVVLGEDLPFGEKGTKGSGISDFIDGTSNTILTVQAAADKAEVWTKPGGIDLDVETPVKTLGKIGETFLALFADGSIHNISKDVDEAVLRALFTHGGREVINNADF